MAEGKISETNKSCPLCGGFGSYTTGGSFGGGVTTHECSCKIDNMFKEFNKRKFENCKYCGIQLNKTIGEINKAKKAGLNLFCNRICAGLNRRKNKTAEQNKLEKKEYDRLYRAKNKEILKAKKDEWSKKDYRENPEKYKQKRRKQYSKHLEYLNTPKYKAYKKDYDEKYLAKNNYGEFWEAAVILKNIKNEIPNFEVKQQQKLINKSQKRKRNYEKIKCKEFERSTLGNIELG